MIFLPILPGKHPFPRVRKTEYHGYKDTSELEVGPPKGICGECVNAGEGGHGVAQLWVEVENVLCVGANCICRKHLGKISFLGLQVTPAACKNPV